MMLHVHGISVLVLLVVITGCGERQETATQSKVFLAEPKVDLGRLPPAARISADWELVNETSRDLKVKTLVLSCSCMATDFVQGILVAGGRKKFRTWVDDPGDGVTVRTGRLLIEGQIDPVEFEWRYEIKSPASLEPNVVNLGNLWLDEPVAIEPRVIKLSQLSQLDKPERITQIEVESRDREHTLMYRVEAVDGELFNGSRLKVMMTPRPDANLGSFSDKVLLGIRVGERRIMVRLLVAGSLFSS